MIEAVSNRMVDPTTAGTPAILSHTHLSEGGSAHAGSRQWMFTGISSDKKLFSDALETCVLVGFLKR